MGWPCRKCGIARAESKVTRSSVITGLEVTWSLCSAVSIKRLILGATPWDGLMGRRGAHARWHFAPCYFSVGELCLLELVAYPSRSNLFV